MEIGVIGTGDMGKLYAREFARVGYKVNCADLLEKKIEIEKDLKEPRINILDDGIAVSRRSDLIFYLVPVEEIERAVAQYGPSTKKDATVSSGTSVMTPAVKSFEKYLPGDVNIINWHWLFGPVIKPQGQNTVLVNHKSSNDSYKKVRNIFEKLETKIIELPSYHEHDRITADTQAVTHVGFETLGTAWKNMENYPWENPTYSGGIDNVKVLMCLRIYGGKPHVYSGLAIHNPFAREQIKQYSKSISDIFSFMIQEDEQRLKERINKIKKEIFGDNSYILLDNKIMGEFKLGEQFEKRKPNSHLSLLSMADTWYKSGVNPYDNMICQTPIYKLRLGIVEYLFRNTELLEETIQTAIYDKEIRRDDLEFHTAVREWSTIINNKDVEGYHKHFEETKEFFKDRIEEGKKKSTELIEKLS